ncbi:hypothetical protein GCM10009037_16330 [Halarchaeum grantii]|uniref:Restriction endonuclease type IV Mrr domain-containing protein n=1 Tax=Halarchaeum grantii TaxID=1193105 RepID=A0A830F9Q4_9EURY|nr:restriction endonuclease [Halarchaeum grantii]GGL33420.1 hypothetical protein GCM10009037_16330 [Halarchaeum grantii]
MAELSEDEIKCQLQQMDPYEFEELVAEIWELQGYETTVRKGSGDRGIDVEAEIQTPVPQKVLIQAKRYSEGNKIGSEEVRKYATLYQQVSDTDTVVIVTTGDFTAEARRLADDLRVKIVDRYSFAKEVANNQRSLSKDYFDKQTVQRVDKASSERKKKTTSKTATHRNKSVSKSKESHGKELGKWNIFAASAILAIPASILVAFVVYIPKQITFPNIGLLDYFIFCYFISLWFCILSLGPKIARTKAKLAIPTTGLVFLFIGIPLLLIGTYLSPYIKLEDLGAYPVSLVAIMSYCLSYLYWEWEWYKHDSQSEYQNDRFLPDK